MSASLTTLLKEFYKIKFKRNSIALCLSGKSPKYIIKPLYIKNDSDFTIEHHKSGNLKGETLHKTLFPP